MSDLFEHTPQYKCHMAAIQTRNRHASPGLGYAEHPGRANTQLPYEISTQAEIFIANPDDVPDLQAELEEMEQLLRHLLREKRPAIKAELIREDNRILLKRQKRYGSEQAMQNDGKPALIQWQHDMAFMLQHLMHMELTEESQLGARLRISPRNTVKEHTQWRSTLILWASDGSQTERDELLHQTKRLLEDQFDPNLKDTDILLDDTSAVPCLHITIKRERLHDLDDFRDRVIELTGAKGRQFGEHSQSIFPDAIRQRIIDSKGNGR